MNSTSALARAIQAAPRLESHSADLRRHTWTFSHTGAPVAAGRYVLLPEAAALRALADDQAAPVAAVIAPAPANLRVRFTTIAGDQALQVHSADYFDGPEDAPAAYSLTLYRDHVVEAKHASWMHPAIWRGTEQRLDQFGCEWQRKLRLTTDDFGTLVPVQR